MYKCLNIIYPFMVCVLFSCSKVEEPIKGTPTIKGSDGVIVSQPSLWVTNLSLENTNIGSFVDPVVYKNIVVTSAIDSSSNGWSLVGLNVSNGDEEWRWNDYFVSDLWFNEETKQVDHLLIKQNANQSNNSGLSIYAINCITGQTHWKLTNGRTLDSRIVVDDHFVYTYFFDVNGSDSSYIPSIYRINSNTGYMDSLTAPPIKLTNFNIYQRNYGKTNGLNAFTDANGIEYLLIPYSEENQFFDSHGDIYLSLYNITNGVYEYSEKLLTSDAVSFMKPTHIYKESIVILNSNKTLFGVDLYTGDIIWEKPYLGGVFSMIIEDNVLVAAQVLGSDAKTFGINPMTGTEFWSIPSGGGASTLKALNGIVYWKDRGDGDLYAVEALTGTKIWQLDDPDPERDSWWRSDAVGIQAGENGEKGKIFASSHRRMYCFEAAR